MDRRLLLIAPYLFWFFFLLLAPFLLVIATSFALRDSLGELTFGFYGDAYLQLLDPIYLNILGRTSVLAIVHTLLTLCAAYPVAFFLSRLPRKDAGMYLSMLMVPFLTNYLIRLLAFMDVLRLQPFGIEWTYTKHGMLAGLIYNYLPFAVLPLYSALEKVPTSLIEAAQDLGASKRRVFTQMLLPLTKRSLFATGLLLFIPSLGEFLVPVIVGGGRDYYLGTFLQQQFLTARNWPLGSAAIVILLFSSLFLLRFGGTALLEEEA